ncbi:tyrosine-type recombinase/integrase [Mesorhizobium sp. A556]
MPRPTRGARLYLHPEERVWLIRDGSITRRTGCGEADRPRAEKRLGEYIAAKFKPVTRESDLAQLSIAEVLTAYGREYAPHQKSAERSGYAIAALAPWWGGKTLADVRGETCRAYARARGKMVKAGTIRRELAALSKAINHWHKEHGPLASVPEVTMPDVPPARDRWLTRSEAAMLLAGALGFYREKWCDVATRREHSRWRRNRFVINRHLARFILLGLYTGSRRGAIFNVQWMANTTGGWIDSDRCVMHRRGEGISETNKRQPPVRLGKRISSHLARWKRIDDMARDEAARLADEPVSVYLHVVNYMGRGVASVRTAWEMAVENAWLDPAFTGQPPITPHVLRHTRATWMMFAGIDIWEAAGALGMSAKTLDKVYGHHHVDFQKNAAEV